MKKILIAPNSFKESADSVTVSKYFRKYLKVHKNIKVIVKPLSDGGDGFLDVCAANFNLKKLHYFITTPFDESEFKCSAGYDEKNKTIYIESAKILGLNIIPSLKRNPVRLNSKGLGDLLKHILKDIEKDKIKADKIIIGIGGTGTNDIGLGAVSRLGLKLFGNSGNSLEILPQNFRTVENFECNKINLPFKIYCVVDVENPLLGESGASKMFAGQKGASEYDIEIMEEGFSNLVNIFSKEGLIKDCKILPGAGGGLAAGLMVFLNAEIIKAEDFILRHLELGKIKSKVDYLITGEGSFDSQSLMKKGAWIIIRNFQNSAEKIFLCCGTIEDEIKIKLNPSIIPIELTKFFNSKEDSMKNVEKGIESACIEIKKILQL